MQMFSVLFNTVPSLGEELQCFLLHLTGKSDVILITCNLIPITCDFVPYYTTLTVALVSEM